ncbi:MAG TPA: carboxypeptidase-like regulatory domain-containing protein, partial [Vicinamibacterales bacterium]|nr:carboxypeptidase-like regulatory domain-containing protein [Vicinamibacterales bacterium]
MRRRSVGAFVAALASVVLFPAVARAQSAFAGVVKDATGAVMPGVTVEAASPVLIEQSKSVVSDASGAYKIIDLRPGTYTLTFTLAGFAAVKKEGIELPSNFTSTINAELRIGAIEETITVAGSSPVVDVSSNNKAQVLPREVLDAVPTAHTIQSVGQLIVGVSLTAPDVGGSQAMQQTYFSVHGSGAAGTSVLMDGMIINGLQGDGAIQSYLNDAGNQEMVYQTGGGSGDSPTSGLKLNMVPREGGNRFSGSMFLGVENWQSDNFTDALKAAGVTSVDKIGTYHDFDVTQGGPFVKDKLWFFGSLRLFTVNKPIASTVVSDGTLAGLAACRATPGSCPQGVDPQTINSGLVRFTWQVSPRNKFSAYVDKIHKERGAAMAPGDDQTTTSVVWTSPLYMTNTVKWTSTVSNKLLIEGGYSSNIERYTNQYQPGLEQPVGTPLWFTMATRTDSAAGTRSVVGPAEYFSYPDRYNAQASASYVT